MVLRDLPARLVAYRRGWTRSARAVDEAAAGLVDWAESAGLAGGAWYGYMWDDPQVVALADCRYDVAVEHPEPPPAGSLPGDVGLHRFPPLRVAEVAMDGAIDVEMRLFDWLYRVWLPTSGYLPDDQPSSEAGVGRPFAHGAERFESRSSCRSAGREAESRRPPAEAHAGPSGRLLGPSSRALDDRLEQHAGLFQLVEVDGVRQARIPAAAGDCGPHPLQNLRGLLDPPPGNMGVWDRRPRERPGSRRAGPAYAAAYRAAR